MAKKTLKRILALDVRSHVCEPPGAYYRSEISNLLDIFVVNRYKLALLKPPSARARGNPALAGFFPVTSRTQLSVDFHCGYSNSTLTATHTLIFPLATHALLPTLGWLLEIKKRVGDRLPHKADRARPCNTPPNNT